VTEGSNFITADYADFRRSGPQGMRDGSPSGLAGQKNIVHFELPPDAVSDEARMRAEEQSAVICGNLRNLR
jgi:hypothetical protein